MESQHHTNKSSSTMNSFRKSLTKSVDGKFRGNSKRSNSKFKSNSNLNRLINNLNLHTTPHNSREDNIFKKRIEKLNLKFYLETEKYLHHKKDLSTEGEKCQESLFYILFQQISLYIEEVERLNIQLLSASSTENNIKEKMEIILYLERNNNKLKKQNENLTKVNKNIERKLIDSKESQLKLKKEIDSLNRQLRFYKDKLKMDMIIKKREERRMQSLQRKANSMNKSFNSYTTFKSIHSNHFMPKFNKNKLLQNTTQNYFPLKPTHNRVDSTYTKLDTYSGQKKSGYYSRSITRQVMTSNESSFERKRLDSSTHMNMNNSLSEYIDKSDKKRKSLLYCDSKSKNKNYATSLLFEDDSTFTNNNASLINDLEIISNAKTSRNPVQQKKHYNEQFNNGIILNNITTITNYNAYKQDEKQQKSNKLNMLKFKLSEQNIKDLITNLNNNLDEEIKWIERVEDELNSMKLMNEMSKITNKSEYSVPSSERKTKTALQNYKSYEPHKKKIFSFKPKKK